MQTMTHIKRTGRFKLLNIYHSEIKDDLVKNNVSVTLKDPLSVHRHRNKNILARFTKCEHHVQIIPYLFYENLFRRAVFLKSILLKTDFALS